MALTYIFMIGCYWMFLSGAVYLTGAFAARIFITGPCGADVCILGEKERSFGEKAVPVILTVSVLTLIASLIHVVLHCSVMTGTPLPEVWDVLPLFLMKTRYGIFSLIRSGVLAVIICIVLLSSRRNAEWTGGAAFACAIALLITLTMSGHQGTKGYLRIPFFLDIVHVLAISLWVGGLFFVYSNYSLFCRGDDRDHHDIFLAFIHRISLMATVCVVLVLGTGTAMCFYSFDSLVTVVSTRYGRVLLIKTGLALILMMIGGMNKFFFIPRLDRTEVKNWTSLCSLRRGLFNSLTLEVYLGLAVLLATSVLTHLSPEE